MWQLQVCARGLERRLMGGWHLDDGKWLVFFLDTLLPFTLSHSFSSCRLPLVTHPSTHTHTDTRRRYPSRFFSLFRLLPPLLPTAMCSVGTGPASKRGDASSNGITLAKKTKKQYPSFFIHLAPSFLHYISSLLFIFVLHRFITSFHFSCPASRDPSVPLCFIVVLALEPAFFFLSFPLSTFCTV